MNTAIRISDMPIRENVGSGVPFSYGEIEGPMLSPLMRAEIDRDIEIAREQFRQGRYRRLDDDFVTEFLEEAHRRNAALFRKNA